MCHNTFSLLPIWLLLHPHSPQMSQGYKLFPGTRCWHAIFHFLSGIHLGVHWCCSLPLSGSRSRQVFSAKWMDLRIFTFLCSCLRQPQLLVFPKCRFSFSIAATTFGVSCLQMRPGYRTYSSAVALTKPVGMYAFPRIISF